jgi:hypothetical protein
MNSATLIFTENNELQQINLSAETDGAAAALAKKLDGILKRPGDELEEINVRSKWLLATIENATLEIGLARLERNNDKSRN